MPEHDGNFRPRETIKKMRQRIQEEDNGVAINLMLTLACNFACGHCFYLCDSTRSPAYMTNEVLASVGDMVDTLNDEGAWVNINLIGGEPTLDLDEFERVFKIVSSWTHHREMEIQMTTNGWWLANEKASRRLLGILGRYAPGFGLDEGFIVRISSGAFHDQHRPKWLQGQARLNHALENMWEEAFYEFIWPDECPECLTKLDPEQPDWCPECEYHLDPEDIIEHPDLTGLIIPPRPDPADPWIYVQPGDSSRSPLVTVIPTGRGATAGGQNDIGARLPGRCVDQILTFTPDGNLSDICCRGSNCQFGTIRDHPLLLLSLARQYVQDRQPTCYGCWAEAADWEAKNLASYRKRLQEELDKEEENAL